MSKTQTPLFAAEASAARLLDMKPGEFRGLVREGLLPGPVERGGYQRWDVEQLARIFRGDVVDGMTEVEW